TPSPLTAGRADLRSFADQPRIGDAGRPPTRSRATRLLDLLAQRLESPAVEGNVVKGFPDDRLGDGSRLLAVATEDDDAGIVVFHRQSPVVLRASHFAYVFARLEPARWNVDRPRARYRLEFLRLTRVDEPRRAIHLVTVRHRLQLDLGRTTQGAPHRDTELVTSDVREAGGQEFLAQPFAAAAEGAAAIEDDW